MRLGTIVLQSKPWTEMAAAFRTAEEIGYDVAYVADHAGGYGQTARATADSA